MPGFSGLHKLDGAGHGGAAAESLLVLGLAFGSTNVNAADRAERTFANVTVCLVMDAALCVPNL